MVNFSWCWCCCALRILMSDINCESLALFQSPKMAERKFRRKRFIVENISWFHHDSVTSRTLLLIHDFVANVPAYISLLFYEFMTKSNMTVSWVILFTCPGSSKFFSPFSLKGTFQIVETEGRISLGPWTQFNEY